MAHRKPNESEDEPEVLRPTQSRASRKAGHLRKPLATLPGS